MFYFCGFKLKKKRDETYLNFKEHNFSTFEIVTKYPLPIIFRPHSFCRQDCAHLQIPCLVYLCVYIHKHLWLMNFNQWLKKIKEDQTSFVNAFSIIQFRNRSSFFFKCVLCVFVLSGSVYPFLRGSFKYRQFKQEDLAIET